jgi:hypothetical protein
MSALFFSPPSDGRTPAEVFGGRCGEPQGSLDLVPVRQPASSATLRRARWRFSKLAEELHMSKKVPESSRSINVGTDRHEDVSARVRSIDAINEVLIHSTIGDDRGNWSDNVLSGLFEAQRMLLATVADEVEAMRLEYLAMSRREAA